MRIVHAWLKPQWGVPAHSSPVALYIACTVVRLARGGELLHLGEHVEEAAVAAGRERLREPARLDQPGLTRVGQ